ncbi:riboflavin-specific deaminase [Endozoicomonas sp. OPT23]|uniref:bifunctional diaminohydroxyphosphoribosylaminopyrimidine deaminase/5-amino-6-(5-phosphoribosylamino)uracil reductase RibD n=1 Tax=Endozoicomonas sp. OPT23 TaxID=2072845 RepID=UPI00129B9BB9|nr:bifunctional diaminohydroxyphosphoribosylaminopyrimidine deaminase/5-amino-6-(5-phosphoribosylamino)uracil reductase RibD [Endozoicomonas sp. OPT23]MRI34032.1 riboflavin-specific deaminase [Endozoicomonas sp. OPT23]
MDQRQKEALMKQAMLEGRKARTVCYPNPPVGCLLVKDGEIIARGHTNKPGEHHAEAMALSQLDSVKNASEGVLAFVTLEPCSFHGRTPSCAKAIVFAGIEKVYVGMIDPHPKNRGAGISVLEAAGVEVEVGIMKESVEADLTPYLSIEQC